MPQKEEGWIPPEKVVMKDLEPTWGELPGGRGAAQNRESLQAVLQLMFIHLLSDSGTAE